MILLVGIPGSGKSSILNVVRKALERIQIVNFGEKMLEETDLENENRDLLRKLPASRQRELGLSSAKKIRQGAASQTIVDTHALIKTDTGYVNGLPLEVLDILKPRLYAFVECDPSIIIQRRSKDPKRKRDVEKREEIALHQELTKTYLSTCALLTQSDFFRVNNNSDSIDANAASFIEAIKALK